MLSVYCVSHKKVDLFSSGMKVVGVAGLESEEGIFSDSDGESISHFNDRFSELTAHYYVWKNLAPASVDGSVGFCHYRRFLVPPSAMHWITDHCSRPFDNRKKGGEGNYSSAYLIEQDKLEALFQSCGYIRDLESVGRGVDIVLPRRNSLPSGGFKGQYQRCHPIEPFNLMIDIISRKDSQMAQAAVEYFDSFEYAYWNNLFITRFEIFSSYCEFAFGVLLQVNAELGSLGGLYQNRVCAFLSERLFNFWIFYQGLTVREIDWCITTEIQTQVEPHQIALKM